MRLEDASTSRHTPSADGQEEAQGGSGRHRHEQTGVVPLQPARQVRGGDRAPGLGGEVAPRGRGAAEGRLRGGARRRGLAAQHAHRALQARAREPRARATPQAAASPPRDRPAHRGQHREGPDDRAHARSTGTARARRSRWPWRRARTSTTSAARSRSATSGARCSARCPSVTSSGQRSSPRSAAQRVSSWRLESWSLRSTEETCASTVFGEMSRRSAISLYM